MTLPFIALTGGKSYELKLTVYTATDAYAEDSVVILTQTDIVEGTFIVAPTKGNL